MHNTVIDPVVKARYMAVKGGREFAFASIDPWRTAHLVVDMQNGFVEAGALLEVPAARNIIGNINAVSQSLRARGGVNLFFRFTTSKASDWAVYFEQFLNTELGAAEVADFQPGTHGHALSPLLDFQPGDLVIDKYRFSAFTPGSSNALEVLKARGIDTVFISGTLTDCCCEATARDAQQLGFRVIFLSDANAALTDAEHNAAINALAAWYADIRTTEQVVALLGAAVGQSEPVAV